MPVGQPMSANTVIFPEKPLASSSLAQDLAAWAAGNDIATIMVFGVDVIFAIRRDGEQAAIPRQFNDVVWGLGLLNAVQAAYKALNNSHCSSGAFDLAITFEAGILPGDPGFELPEPTRAGLETPASELIVEGTIDG